MEENAGKVPDKIRPFVAFPSIIIIKRLKKISCLYTIYIEEKEK